MLLLAANSKCSASSRLVFSCTLLNCVIIICYIIEENLKHELEALSQQDGDDGDDYALEEQEPDGDDDISDEQELEHADVQRGKCKCHL